ncbi:hypothetical protein D3C79_456000 [compost metagenome]
MEIDVRRQCRQCAQTQTAHRQALPLCLPLAGRNRLALQSPGSQDAIGRQPAGGASTLLQLGTDPAIQVQHQLVMGFLQFYQALEDWLRALLHTRQLHIERGLVQARIKRP